MRFWSSVFQNKNKKYFPHYYTTTSRLNCWHKADLDFYYPTIWILQQKSRFIKLGPIFKWPSSVNLWLLYPEHSCAWMTGVGLYMVHSCSPIHPKVSCVVHSVMFSCHCSCNECYFSYCSVPVSLNQSVHCPLVSLINKPFQATEQLLARGFSSLFCLWQTQESIF